MSDESLPENYRKNRWDIPLSTGEVQVFSAAAEQSGLGKAAWARRAMAAYAGNTGEMPVSEPSYRKNTGNDGIGALVVEGFKSNQRDLARLLELAEEIIGLLAEDDADAEKHGPVAQGIERQPSKLDDAGSSPAGAVSVWDEDREPVDAFVALPPFFGSTDRGRCPKCKHKSVDHEETDEYTVICRNPDCGYKAWEN